MSNPIYLTQLEHPKPSRDKIPNHILIDKYRYLQFRKRIGHKYRIQLINEQLE